MTQTCHLAAIRGRFTDGSRPWCHRGKAADQRFTATGLRACFVIEATKRAGDPEREAPGLMHIADLAALRFTDESTIVD